MLTTVFAIAGLLLAFGHIAEEVLEGDATSSIRRSFSFFAALMISRTRSVLLGLKRWPGTFRPWGSYAVLSVVLCAVIIYLFMDHERAAAFWVIAAVGGGVLLSNLLKLVYERSRLELVPHAARVFTTSFPSGHATLSASTYLTLGALLASLHGSLRFKVTSYPLANQFNQ
jgi:undecaprenyl-diphosphatase